MKKLYILTAALLLSASLAAAQDRIAGVPVSQNGYDADVSYAGVDYSTVTFSSKNVLGFTGEGVIIGFIASSNTLTSNYISFCDTAAALSTGIGDVATATSSAYATWPEVARVYLSTDSFTNGINNVDDSLGTTYKFPQPIRVKAGGVWKANGNTINLITVLFNAFKKQ